MTTHKIPEMKCLACDSKLNRASEDKVEVAPNEGDFTICMYCSHIMAFKADNTLRELTKEEAKEAESDQAVMDILGMVQLYQKMYRSTH